MASVLRVIFLSIFAFVVFALPSGAIAKPRRHPAELDLMMRAEWDGDLNKYLKELKAEKRLQIEARAEQKKMREQEESAQRKNRESFIRERANRDRAAHVKAFRDAYADMLQYKRQQNRIRKEYAAERAAGKLRKKETRTVRVSNFKAVRLALIRYHHELQTRKPAMLKMPKPDTASLKEGGAGDGMGNAFAPPLPPPTMDMANMPNLGMPPPPDPGQPQFPPPPAFDQTASAAPSFAPSGAETGRAFGGSAR